MSTTRVAALVVAAGQSRRMGSPKALLALGNSTFFGEIVATSAALDLSPRVCVTNLALHGELAAVAAEFEFLLNERPEDGMLRSVQLGCRRLREGESAIAGAMLFLVDNPGSLLARTRKVLAAAQEKPGDFNVAAYKRQPGHPVYIPARAFEGILSWTGENGLRGFIASSGIPSHAVATGKASTLHDVDTPAELERIRNVKRSA